MIIINNLNSGRAILTPADEISMSAQELFVKRHYHSDGEVFIDLDLSKIKNKEDPNILIVMDFYKNPEAVQQYYQIMNELHYYTQTQVEEHMKSYLYIALITPYLSYARADKIEFNNKVPPLDSFLRVLTGPVRLPPYILVSVDVHTSKIPFAVNGTRVVSLNLADLFAKEIISRYDKQKLLFVAPDHGAETRTRMILDSYREFMSGEKVDTAMIVLDKVRDPETKKPTVSIDVSKLPASLKDYQHRTVIIVDDMVDSGQTLLRTTELLEDTFKPLKTVYCISHVVGDSLNEEFVSDNRDFITLDTVYHESLPAKVDVIDTREYLKQVCNKCVMFNNNGLFN